MSTVPLVNDLTEGIFIVTLTDDTNLVVTLAVQDHHIASDLCPIIGKSMLVLYFRHYLFCIHVVILTFTKFGLARE